MARGALTPGQGALPQATGVLVPLGALTRSSSQRPGLWRQATARELDAGWPVSASKSSASRIGEVSGKSYPLVDGQFLLDSLSNFAHSLGRFVIL